MTFIVTTFFATLGYASLVCAYPHYYDRYRSPAGIIAGWVLGGLALLGLLLLAVWLAVRSRRRARQTQVFRGPPGHWVHPGPWQNSHGYFAAPPMAQLNTKQASGFPEHNRDIAPSSPRASANVAVDGSPSVPPASHAPLHVNQFGPKNSTPISPNTYSPPAGPPPGLQTSAQ